MQNELQMQNELKRFSYQLQKCSTCYRNSALARDAAPAAALAGKAQHLHVNRELVPFYKNENCYTGYSNGFLRQGQFGALTGKSKDHQKRHETPFNILVRSAHPPRKKWLSWEFRNKTALAPKKVALKQGCKST